MLPPDRASHLGIVTFRADSVALTPRTVETQGAKTRSGGEVVHETEMVA